MRKSRARQLAERSKNIKIRAEQVKRKWTTRGDDE